MEELEEVGENFVSLLRNLSLLVMPRPFLRR
jgi:hypothetical protein